VPKEELMRSSRGQSAIAGRCRRRRKGKQKTAKIFQWLSLVMSSWAEDGEWTLLLILSSPLAMSLVFLLIIILLLFLFPLFFSFFSYPFPHFRPAGKASPPGGGHERGGSPEAPDQPSWRPCLFSRLPRGNLET
jgi:hypothetical protein